LEDDHRREDEWFRENEKQMLEAARVARARREQERADKEAASDRKRLREMHYMKCPKCGHDLNEQDLAGVKIDRCTHCEGVFFDAGELDQIFAKKAEERRGFFRRLAGI
jgi:acetyl-CoA carboxylase beta subunit